MDDETGLDLGLITQFTSEGTALDLNEVPGPTPGSCSVRRPRRARARCSTRSCATARPSTVTLGSTVILFQIGVIPAECVTERGGRAAAAEAMR
jgi:hypothetical protein